MRVNQKRKKDVIAWCATFWLKDFVLIVRSKWTAQPLQTDTALPWPSVQAHLASTWNSCIAYWQLCFSRYSSGSFWIANAVFPWAKLHCYLGSPFLWSVRCTHRPSTWDHINEHDHPGMFAYWLHQRHMLLCLLWVPIQLTSHWTIALIRHICLQLPTYKLLCQLPHSILKSVTNSTFLLFAQTSTTHSPAQSLPQ